MEEPLPPLHERYGSTSLAGLRLAGFFVVTLLMVVVHVPYCLLFPRDRYRLAMLFHRTILKLIGIKVQTHGEKSTAKPTFFVSNHVSYLDIPVLGSLIPGSFVAKAEVASWPIFGFLAKLQNTVFIERRSMRAKHQRDHLKEVLQRKYSLIVFPEGTSSDGQLVLPFKTSIFSGLESAAGHLPVAVQPISIACRSIDGFPAIYPWRHVYGWFGDMTLTPHLWQILKCCSLTVDVVFHPPLAVNGLDRKQLAALCRDRVAIGVEHAVTGRWPKPTAEPAHTSEAA